MHTADELVARAQNLLAVRNGTYNGCAAASFVITAWQPFNGCEQVEEMWQKAVDCDMLYMDGWMHCIGLASPSTDRTAHVQVHGRCSYY